MELHTLKKIKSEKTARRVGRGGKRGTTSGRGQKGQKSRSGRRIRPAVRDLVQRIAKRRGFRNKPKSAKPMTVSLRDIEKKMAALANAGSLDVNRETLTVAGLIPKGYQGEVKVVGGMALKKVFRMRGIQFSQSVKEAVEKAGGTVI